MLKHWRMLCEAQSLDMVVYKEATILFRIAFKDFNHDTFNEEYWSPRKQFLQTQLRKLLKAVIKKHGGVV